MSTLLQIKKQIVVSRTVYETLKQRYDSVLNRINNKQKQLKQIIPFTKLTYNQQGSYKLNTLVKNSNNSYDIDFGIYFYITDVLFLEFKSNPNKSKYIKQKLYNVLYDSKITNISNKNKCIRFEFRDYGTISNHLDLTFYLVNSKNEKLLLTNNGSQPSDPIKFYKEYLKHKQKNKDIQEVIILLKAWNKKKNVGLTGFIITTLVMKYSYIQKNNQNFDLFFLKVIIEIINGLNQNFQLLRTYSPDYNEDLLLNLLNKKNKILLDLNSLKDCLQNHITYSTAKSNSSSNILDYTKKLTLFFL